MLAARSHRIPAIAGGFPDELQSDAALLTQELRDQGRRWPWSRTRTDLSVSESMETSKALSTSGAAKACD